MRTNYSEPTIAALSSHSLGARTEEDSKAGHYMYQGATILAILLFLISFWSC